MISTRNLMAGLLAAFIAVPAFAADIKVMDAYARSASPGAVTGAAFMHVMNTGAEEDRLIAAASPAAEKVELHTHEEDANGVMRMIHVEEGFVLPAGETLMLERGGKHVMLMGLTGPLAQDDMVEITLTFEQAGEIKIEVPVDLERQGGHSMDHGSDHGASDGS
ncbi:copper chaperone PCu(A)C [Roseovarius sp. LXJ103]|uniref:copper chaperone PCu(A)C n=1 Tax=Roseovarius carneus TaxID=2853164 RepID=UPI000D61D5C7|nr:copper chaperone PCu(A)C [Roseovarius carneus]MBZ8117109.1 copper chaperone PCu(A)C [Roseovarius carneus]PWE37046.1 copper-binding protein [Pelagicola sp. LXJ1103]